jgi:ATP-binding protein involved in chromosome partitioning
MSWFEDPAGNRHHLMGDGGGEKMAKALGLPLLGQLPMVQAIREGGDSGTPAALTDDAIGATFTGLAREVALSLDALQTKPAPAIIFED